MKGPTFLLILRPETFDILGLGTGIIDIENHIGPKVIDVIMGRIDLFCNSPELFFQPGRGLAEEEFKEILLFFRKIRDTISSDRNKVFESFILSTCGYSIRSGLVMMQGLFYTNKAVMMADTLSVHDIIRICIKNGNDQLFWKPGQPINHMFRVANRNGDSLLVKARILRYLGRHPKGKRRLNEILNVLSGFEYDSELIVGALNDLMSINSQLIRSNGFDEYEENAISKYGGNTILLTEIGESYANELINNIDYLQEIILDTYVDGDLFPHEIGYTYLVDKFRLLYQFLNELRKIDIDETQKFVDKWSEKSFIDSFGEHLITLDIIHGIYLPVLRILDTDKIHSFEAEDLETYFSSLALQIEEDNRLILKVDVPTVVSK
jgi:hypothetical protein